MWREFTLIKRTIVVYKAKTLQVVVTSLVAATLFLRTHIHPISPNDGQEIAGYCFFATLVMLFNGIAELSMSVSLTCTAPATACGTLELDGLRPSVPVAALVTQTHTH